ncbi:MAG: UDP-glucose 4-epimerase GalE [Candidatus Cloacimonetes bacterium]|nr:UDP-glucose 4-epimerase GalE [Candidatus Cloacimonadota bacterium]
MKTNSKNILLTGGTGYIGSHTAVELLNAGYHVTIFDNLSNSKIEVLSRIEIITGAMPEFEQIDLRDEAELSKGFDKYSFDAVIHFAGLKSVGESVTNPLDTYENNLLSTIYLLKVMRKKAVLNLIFSGSATVYAIPETLPIKENNVLGADCPYGRSKLMIEEILTDLSVSDPEWKIQILRYFNPVGAHPTGLIGEDPSGIPSNLFPYLSRVAQGVYKELKIFGSDYKTSDGTCIRDYIHVVDLAKGHLSTLSRLDHSSGMEIFNLGTGHGYSVLEVVKAYEKASGIKIPYIFTERRKGDIPISYADPTKAEHLLGWKAEKTIDDMCKDAWNWQTKNPNGYIKKKKE